MTLLAECVHSQSCLVSELKLADILQHILFNSCSSCIFPAGRIVIDLSPASHCHISWAHLNPRLCTDLSWVICHEQSSRSTKLIIYQKHPFLYYLSTAEIVNQLYMWIFMVALKSFNERVVRFQLFLVDAENLTRRVSKCWKHLMSAPLPFV